MSEINNIKENFENVNNNFESDVDFARLKQELHKKFHDYQTTMRFMLADAPIDILCLPPSLHKVLTDQGFLRIYDLFDVDLVKVKGLGVVRVKQLTSSLDQFFSML